MYFPARKLQLYDRIEKNIIALKYRCEIKVIPWHQSNLIFHSMYTSHVYSFIFGFAKRFSLAFSEVANFFCHYLVSRRQILRCVETVQCLSSVAATFSGCMLTRDIITRFRDNRNIPSWNFTKRFTHCPRSYIVISIFTVLQNRRLHLFRNEFSCYTCARARIFREISNTWQKIKKSCFFNIL